MTSQVLYNETSQHGLGEESGYCHFIREENKGEELMVNGKSRKRALKATVSDVPEGLECQLVSKQ